MAQISRHRQRFRRFHEEPHQPPHVMAKASTSTLFGDTLVDRLPIVADVIHVRASRHIRRLDVACKCPLMGEVPGRHRDAADAIDDGELLAGEANASEGDAANARRLAQRRSFLKPIIRGQRILGTIIGVIGIPTVILTGFNTYLSLRPTVSVNISQDQHSAEV
jgi:hypothetical protein